MTFKSIVAGEPSISSTDVDFSTPHMVVGTGRGSLVMTALSPREIEILRQVGTGQSNQEIGAALGVSVNCVKFHIKNIHSKLGAKRRTDALRIAQILGLLDTQARSTRGVTVVPGARFQRSTSRDTAPRCAHCGQAV